jgi:hypothetical protein
MPKGMVKPENLHKYRSYEHGKECREVVYIHSDMIELTNSKTNPDVVNEIVNHYDPKMFPPVTGLIIKDKVTKNYKLRLTDGNHRTLAAKKLKCQFIPAILLSEKEYKHVAYSYNTISINCRMPLHPFYLLPLGVQRT